MATETLLAFLRRLTRRMPAATLDEPSDRQLVERFLSHHDNAIFEALLRRHGPMVYRVCWRVLSHGPDAEDAFQATFLLLAQNLAAVRSRDSLAAWLHGVAHRVALKARARASIRHRHERQVPVKAAAPADDLTWGELRDALDSELAQLPETWRLPLVLCHLEGRTQDEAARQLGWSKSTVRRRLEAGRAALGRRLTQRGLVVGAALAAGLVSECAASAVVPSGLVQRTTTVAVHVASGAVPAEVASPQVSALTEGVRTMTNSKLGLTMVVALMIGVAALGVVTAFSKPPVMPARQNPKPSDEGKTEKKRLAVEMIGESCLVLSVTTELQRASIWNMKKPCAYVLLDGEKLLGSDGKVDPTGLDLVALRKALTARRGTDKEAGVMFQLFFTSTADVKRAGEEFLIHVFRQLGRDARFEFANVSFTYNGNPSPWQDVVASVQGQEGDEPAVGNELAKAYPVRTALSRALCPGSDCIVDIFPPFDKDSDGNLKPEVVEAVRAHIGKLKLETKGQVQFVIRCKYDNRSVADKFTNAGPSKNLAESLGFTKSAVQIRYE